MTRNKTRKCKFSQEYYLSPSFRGSHMIYTTMPTAQTFLFLLAFCYRIPPAIQEAGSRISFGIWVIPAERQTAGAP